ncbi:chromosome segregation protein SMC [Candidatus Woesearchaeota archaeon]|nr:chromosome segregation protein SMC [Nanoarchaeota archaeon]MCB9370138.1 chromosome segregation protein SMC [Candidatus Woesearchaeota archaeon]USN44668.1 MAG: chromosome segregation protein SMC [Candidatus Woesearchaeota archaeon]
MTFIKRMKLEGFKSFANPTTISFEQGFNTIVGANGSGKSNVFDALCFVLGRMSSKGLRAEKLGNLVFNGGKNLKPARAAEVSIFLSNEQRELLDSELDEIKISRVVKKDGSSTYLLNNVKVTRTEIVEILRRAYIDPDGYNIILQGDIMRIVNMSPLERRELIEEISNVSGYEEKREKAMKKLGQIELDLKNADLLMEEKSKYLKELKSEKEQAEKFHSVKEDLRFNNLLLIKAKIVRNAQLKAKKEEEHKELEEVLSKHKVKLDDISTKQKEIDEQITEIEKEIEVKSHKDFIAVTNTITSLEGEVKLLSEKKAEYTKQKEEVLVKERELKESLKKGKEELSVLEKEITELSGKKSLAQKELEGFEKDLAELKKGVGSGGFEEIEELEVQIDELMKQKHDKVLLRQDNAVHVEKLNAKLEHLQDEQKKIDDLIKENSGQAKELDSYRKELKDLIVKTSSLASKHSEHSARYGKLNREMEELSEQCNKLRMKAETSRDLMATNRAVDAILKCKAQDKAIHGSVSELASVPEKYSLALEAVAGKNTFNIVVDSDSTAVKYINYLRDNKIGSVTFLPLNKVTTKFKLEDSVLRKKGVVDYALNLVKFDPEYQNIFHLVFQDTLVIERIEDAKFIGIGDYKMVTLMGDLVAKSGAMSGGFKSRSKGIGAFKDDKTSEQLSAMEAKLSSLHSSVDHIRGERDDCERQLYDARVRKMEVEAEIAKIEKVLSVGGSDPQRIASEMEALLGDKTVIDSSLQKISREISGLDEALADLQKKKQLLRNESSERGTVMADIASFEEKRDAARNKLIELSSFLETSSIKMNSVLLPELKNIEKIIKDGELSQKQLSELIAQTSDKLKQLSSELGEHRAREKELSKGYQEFISRRDGLREQKKEFEEKYAREFEKFDKVKEKASGLRYAIEEYGTLQQSLNEELEIVYEDLRVELMEGGEGEQDEKVVEELIDRVDEKLSSGAVDVKELQNKVNTLKSKLNSFGSINMKAVQIYDKLNEEFTALLDKRQTLNVERDDILQFIAEIDEKKKEKFLQTFASLKEHFIRIFSLLSSKGEAELDIENEKDLFNSGVDIRVRLSKNNYLDIKSLSGGEKTITAIAFIFAVQEFNPASFYIFDEVDAALDIMNCEKLGQLVLENSSKAQYIVVSHSEHFVQNAQTIFGVTMDKNKVSGVVSLDLSETAKYVDAGGAEPEAGE